MPTLCTYDIPAAFDAAVWEPKLTHVLAVGWLLMLITFNPSVRSHDVAMGSSLDTVAVIKVAARAGAFVWLSFCACQLLNSRGVRPVLWLLLPWGLFCAWGIISTAWSPLKSVSLGQSGSLAILAIYSACIAILVTRHKHVSWLLCALTASLWLICGVLIALRLLWPECGALTRESFGVMHSTNASSTAGLGFLLLIVSRVRVGWRWSRFMLIPGGGTFAFAMILANNRLSIAITVALATFAIFLYGSAYVRAISLFGCSICGTVYLVCDPHMSLVGGVVEKVMHYVSRGQSNESISSLSGRGEMWAAIWESYLKSPWIGHGYFVTSATGEIYVWDEWTNWTAHNLWLQVFVSTGLIGANLFFFGVTLPLGRMLSQACQGRTSPRVASIITFAAVWFFGWGLLNESILGPLTPESVVFATLLGLAARLGVGDCSLEGQGQGGELTMVSDLEN